MRPLELVVEGFRSWETRTTFDLRERHLVAIVGPIGSGKEPILDAIAFALYARTPRIEKEVASLIRHGCDEARVELLFEAGGHAYRAIRVIKRKGANLHALWRYANPSGDGEPIERLDRVRDIDERLGIAIGLDFTAFCRSVLLAQNQFARFLEAAPAERDAVLKGLFGFDRLDQMRELARQREERCRIELGTVDRRLAELATLEQQLPALESGTLSIRERVDQLRAAAPEFVRLREQRTAATEPGRDAGSRLQALDAIRGEIPAVERIEDLAAGASSRQHALEQAQARLAEVDTELAACEAEETETQRQIDGLTASVHLEAVGRAGAAFETAAAEAGRQTRLVDAARERLDAAQLALRAAEHQHYAALLRDDLCAGDPCPVCARPVESTPPPLPAPGLDAARGELEAAATAHTSAVQSKDNATRVAAAAEARRDHARTTFEGWRAAHPEVEASADADPQAALASTTARLNALQRTRRSLRSRQDGARTEVSQAQAAVGGASAALIDASRGLERIAGRLELPAVAADPVAATREVLEVLERRHAETSALLAQATTTQRQTDAALGELARTVGLEPTAHFDGALAEAERALARAEAELAALRDRLIEVGARRKEQTSWRGQLSVWASLSEDLRPSRLLRHLLEEERRILSALAAERFEALSGGRYRFSLDGSFAVVDLANAEEVRKLDTLSGGETFLAALALALALAEIVAGSGGRLDAFFLDEGFGSLDQEHLRLALDGIEHLVVDAPERLVLLVSHVAEVQERFDDVILLDRDPLQGASIVRRGATAQS